RSLSLCRGAGDDRRTLHPRRSDLRWIAHRGTARLERLRLRPDLRPGWRNPDHGRVLTAGERPDQPPRQGLPRPPAADRKGLELVVDYLDVRQLVHRDEREDPPDELTRRLEDQPPIGADVLGGLDQHLDPTRVHERQSAEVEREISALSDLSSERVREHPDVRSVEL